MKERKGRTNTEDFENSKKASELRKEGKYSEALDKYKLINTKSCYDYAGIMHCLRKLGECEEAVKVGKENLNTCSNLDWFKSEYAWALVDRYMPKEGVDVGEELYNVILEILEIKDDKLIKNTILSRAIPYFSEKELFNEGNQILDLLSDEELFNGIPLKREPKTEMDKKVPTFEERWFSSKMKFLYSMDQYDEMLKISELAVRKVPYSGNIERQKGKALHELGRVNEALKVFQSVAKKNPGMWYLHQDIGDAACELGNKEMAIKEYSKACLGKAQLSSKVKVLIKLGDLLKEQDSKKAKEHYVLSSLVREQEGWTVTFELNDRIKALKNIVVEQSDISKLEKELEKYWKVLMKN